MLYFIWGVINIIPFIYFIFICYKATILVRKNIGLFAAIFFVLVIFSFFGHFTGNKDNKRNYKKETNSNVLNGWTFAKEDSDIINNRPLFSVDVTLDKTPISSYILTINYREDLETKKLTPVSGNTITLGNKIGVVWVPTAVSVNSTSEKDKLKYSITGVLEWQLLGITIYSQPNSYIGFASLK